MPRNVVITGLGLITPLGRNVAQTWEALLRREFIRDHARVGGMEFPAGRPRVNHLAITAAKEAVTSAGWNDREIARPDTALVVGTSKGPVENWLTAPPHMSSYPYESAGRFHVSGLAETSATVAGDVKLGNGPRLTLSAACASGLHALIRATMMIRTGQVHRAIVVAAEASVHPLFLGSFKRLGVLPADGIGCRPFDETRDGFLMSESAAAVCVEGIDDMNGRVVAGMDRLAIAGDAVSITTGDPGGEHLARMIRQAMPDESVDQIHAHGTGTPVNDPVEVRAMAAVIPNPNRPSTSDNP